jgi:hypothetical protein
MEFILLNEGGQRSRPIKAWVNGVSVEGEAQKQLYNIASMTEVVGPHIASEWRKWSRATTTTS